MAIEVEWVKVKQSRVTHKICDKCGLKVSTSVSNPKEAREAQEFLHIDRVGGHRSIFGDETEICLDICQHCLYEWVKELL